MPRAAIIYSTNDSAKFAEQMEFIRRASPGEYERMMADRKFSAQDVVFAGAATVARGELEHAGYATQVVKAVTPDSPRSFADRLDGQIDVLVLFAHGGNDGPAAIFRGVGGDNQISVDDPNFSELAEFLATKLRAGLLIVDACNSAGWVHAVASRAKIHGIGSRQKTPAADTGQARAWIRWALVGGPRPPSVVVYDRGGGEVRNWEGWLSVPK